MSKFIVLVNGKRFAGKDTVANLITDAKRLALADAVRNEYVQQCNGTVTFEELVDRDRKEKHRSAIIALSEGRKRTHGKTYWIRKLYKDHIASASAVVFVISDWRFIDEYKFFFEENDDDDDIIVLTLRVNATNETRKQRGWIYNAEIDESIGETGLDRFDFDYVIDNNGSIEELQSKIRSI